MPKARRSYFLAVWQLIKWAAGALLIVALLVTWTVNDTADAEPAPSPPSSTPRR